MLYVATLIAPPGSDVLTREHVHAVKQLLPGAKRPHWLSRGEAVDIPFWPQVAALFPGSTEPEFIRRHTELVRAVMYDLPVDCIIQRNDRYRRKSLFIADMDSTMIGQECIDELAAHVGKKDHVAAITERAMRGEIAFEPALRERVAVLKGLPASVVDEVIAQSITLTPGGRTLIATMKAQGAYTALVSGGFTLFTQVIAGMLGFDHDCANTLLLEGAALSGHVQEPILGKQAKLDALVKLRDARHLNPRATLAVGDGANDLAMLDAAGLGVAYHAKPAVAAAAQARIDHADLTALLFAQGYKRAEFIS